jgi:hypothetical protein
VAKRKYGVEMGMFRNALLNRLVRRKLTAGIGARNHDHRGADSAPDEFFRRIGRLPREFAMTRLTSLACCMTACALIASPLAAAKDDPSPQVCAVRAAGMYGFQCSGLASTGAALEPVTFVGTVEGGNDAFYDGTGTFNSSQGSNTTHVAGYASFGKNCFGRVAYTTNEILLPGGGKIPLPPLIIDFVPVDGFNEILGTPVAPGATGDLVPRLSCRLVRIR